MHIGAERNCMWPVWQKRQKVLKKAHTGLSEIAGRYGMTVVMSNSVGMCEDGLCAGKSAVWNSKGELLAQLDDVNEGILILDTETQTVDKKTI